MANPSSPRSSCSGVTSFSDYYDTGSESGNESSGSHCYRVCQKCNRPNPNCDDLRVCCCKDCFRSDGVECDDECDVEYLLKKCQRLSAQKGLMLLRMPSPICPLRLCTKIRLRQVLEFAFASWVRSSQVEWLREGLGLYRDPQNERYWICKAKTCDGCVVRWLYLDTLIHISGRSRDQIQLESNAGASFEWLRGEIELFRDPTSESLWICPAQSSEGSGYPWLHVATLMQMGKHTDRGR